jgi:hypothetical protein
MSWRDGFGGLGCEIFAPGRLRIDQILRGCATPIPARFLQFFPGLLRNPNKWGAVRQACPEDLLHPYLFNVSESLGNMRVILVPES